ncbi:putative porin [Abyssalbus ytuae]|uniref:Porin n=1 Tax=Abyssalbus ytuae TaxID=2926907 RepID=A0A9E7A0C8_9FLAO|nr:putative porin [Abyssalbus ytuae]UOB18532.1 putative porin [Abyssalbus ytuae]
MKKVCLIFWLLLTTQIISAQDKPLNKEQQDIPVDSIPLNEKPDIPLVEEYYEPSDTLQGNNTEIKKDIVLAGGRPRGIDTLPAAETQITIKDYKIISLQRDTVSFDTTLTIQKEYKYNYLRRDDFELLPFNNVGQTYNSLAVDANDITQYPQLGARAKHFNYLEVEDINYYHVPTPTTELFFKTVMEQGQILDAFITMNTSRQFNFSIAYKGMRSLGKYQHILSSTGNFRFTSNYLSKNKRYNLRLHYTSQDILNEENGGLLLREQFESGEDEFIERGRIDVNYENAENFLLGKRYFIDHDYAFLRNNDSTRHYSLSLGHRFNYETKLYRFEQSQQNDLFDESFATSSLRDQARLKTMYNQIRLKYNSGLLGSVILKANLYNYNYYFNSIVITDDQIITNQLKDDEIAVGAGWNKNIGGFGVYADINSNISGDMGGTKIYASAKYSFTQDDVIKFELSSTSRMPNFNFLLYQSDYKSYNWQNTDVFLKEETQNIGFSFKSDKWLNIDASYSKLKNYTYFGLAQIENAEEGEEQPVAQAQPYQLPTEINYLKVKVNKEFRFLKNFALNNTIMYQQVDQENDVLNVPEIITRNTLYYSNHLFKKALYLQTGVTFKYFTEYYANAYNPLLGEFYIQDQEKIGAFPLLDFFINAKVQRTRIYFKAEHFNSSFTGYDFYSAPNNPYRDFIIRFGLVWNFFS